MEIDPQNFKEVIVIGGGTCGLAVCARLCEQFPSLLYSDLEHQRFHWLRQRGGRTKSNPSKLNPHNILVLDEAGDRFCCQWDNQFASCQIPHLRSPMFFHCDPSSIDGLYSFAFLNHREQELKEIKNVVGKEYSKHQAKHQAKRHRVPAPMHLSHDVAGAVDVNMRDQRDYFRPSTKLFHDACQELVQRYHLEECVRHAAVENLEYTELMVGSLSGKGFAITTQDGTTYGAKVVVMATGHRGQINYPILPFTELSQSCHTTHIFKHQVRFPPVGVNGGQFSHVTIIGGGLTSAQLAHVCVLNGIQVNLLLRGSLKVKHFDFHLDWVTKYRNLRKLSFYIQDSDEQRLQMIQDARQGGSVNPEYYKILQRHVKNGRLTLMKYTTVEEAVFVPGDSAVCGHENGKWELTLNTGEHLTTDYVICATGISQNLHAIEFLKPILERHPIETVGGFPCLTENLQYNDLPLFMVGKNATLRVGPSSANIDGARLGGERVGWFIQKQFELGAYNWLGEEQVVELKEFLASKFNWYTMLAEA